MNHIKKTTITLVRLIILFGFLLGLAPAGLPRTLAATAAPEQPAALTDLLTLNVVAARTEPNADIGPVTKGDAVAAYQWLISVDNTGNPLQPREEHCTPFLADGVTRDPLYPAACDWPSLRTVPGWAPVFTQGDETDWNGSTALQLPPGKYLVSVMANGFKIDGQHFSVPMEEPAVVTVEMHPTPLPPATMRIKVFEDIAMTNGFFDSPGEYGLEGFQAIINDTAGPITVDLFGNPLCTEYVKDGNGNVVLDGDGNPQILTLGAGCFSDANGDIVIPNIGPLRYDVFVVPPDGTNWTETSTLEGSWSFDTWLMEGGTGLDNEFVNAAEPFPWTYFAFVRPTAPYPVAPDTGTVRGAIVSALVYTPFTGGLPYQGGVWGGLSGSKIDAPINRPWIALNDLQRGDVATYVGQGNPDGTFEIPNVPPGNYMLTYWDTNLLNIVDWIQITVKPNEITEVGTQFLTSWFTTWYGTVFVDANENGKRDPGEQGVPDFVVALKDRDNTLIDRMSITATTDPNGNYIMEKAYPMSSWMILEAYNDRYYTTGVTYQASNQPTPTTILGNGVDVGVLPIIGQKGRLDWGVKPYPQGKNGGIVGTVFYDAVRNEKDARFAAVESFSAGIPDLTVNVYLPVACGTNPGAPCDALNKYELDLDGSLKKGPMVNTTVTETYVRPTDCQPRDVNGDPVNFYPMPPATGGYDCLEAPMTGVQFENGFSAIDGNYGFTTIWQLDANGQPVLDGSGNPVEVPMPTGDYLVEVEIPNDPVFNRPLYKFTSEESVNVFSGDSYVPQIPPPPCAGALHTVDVAGAGTDGYPQTVLPNGVVIPASTPVENPTFVEDIGGSPYEGQPMPSCGTKLITVSDQRSVAPAFTLYTDVVIPGRWKGYIINDLILETDPKQLFFGEKAGVPLSPIGLYDWSNRRLETIISDPNGVFEVLLPSTDTFNCPTPTGICVSVYYIIGNDPGTPGNPEPLYNPSFRTIGASFEVYPGVIVPADLAPTNIGVSVLAPGSQFNTVACQLDATNPQLFAVNEPVFDAGTGGTLTINGLGFGALQGTGNVTLGGVELAVSAWSDRQIDAVIPPGLPAGTHQLQITGDNGLRTVNGLTIHLLGSGYNPAVFTVGPGKTFATIQEGIDAASAVPQGLVVVYPGQQVPFTNPNGVYFENPIINKPVKVQGVGPGGAYPEGGGVAGVIVDGTYMTGDTGYSQIWREKVNTLSWDGNQVLYEGQVFSFFALDGDFTDAFTAALDGLTIQGGDQQGFGGTMTNEGPLPGTNQVVTIQGGGIYANAYVRHLQITNNIIRSNGGAYGGAIRLGTPHITTPNHNENAFIAYNRMIANGGTNLAGGVALFMGSDNYEVAFNDICGNFSAEYGGGISHYGYSPNGKIHDNRIYFNRSYDEGGGVMIAGELPAVPGTLSTGAGPVDVYNNIIQSNLANDDGGGLRFLMAGDFEYNVYNNIIVNNISTHEGGGIALLDAPNVRIYNNTIMKNITTATAMTSNGLPAPAGISTAANSSMLQATLDPSADLFSNPVLFNNILWDNRAGTFDGSGVSGIGQPGDPAPIFNWDLGVADNTGILTPKYSLLQVPYGLPDATNTVGANPHVVAEYDTNAIILPWRGNANFVGVDIVAIETPITLMGNYHLGQASVAAINKGIDAWNAIFAPGFDIDNGLRPVQEHFDIGADEYDLMYLITHLPFIPKLDYFVEP